MTIRFAILTVAILLTGTPTLLAHDGHAHTIMGTVTARDAKRVEVKTPGGEVLSIAITAKTAVVKDKKKSDIKEVQVGRRVVVDIGNGEDPLVAREIQVGTAPAASAAGH